MSGKAMLTIVASTMAMNTPSEETASTVDGFGARRRIGSRSVAIRPSSRGLSRTPPSTGNLSSATADGGRAAGTARVDSRSGEQGDGEQGDEMHGLVDRSGQLRRGVRAALDPT